MNKFKGGAKVNGHKVNTIRYGDGAILLIANNLKELQRVLDIVSVVCDDYGLQLNVSKTKYTVIGKPKSPIGPLMTYGK